MLTLKGFLKENEMTYKEVEKILIDLGFVVKPTKVKTRLSIITDKRSQDLNKVLASIKGARLSKDRKDLGISSIGVVRIGQIQVVAKPATKNVLKAEQEATDSLIKIIRQAVEQEGNAIQVLIGKYIINAVVTAGSDQIRGDPKADIALIDENGKEVGFISHKKEGGAKAFQQYSGVSAKAGEKIYNNALLNDYISELYAVTKKLEAKSSFSAWRKIPNTTEGRKLASMAVYGPDWGGQFGRNSVHCIGQGSPTLTRQPNGSYRLTFSESIHTADDIDWAFKSDYQVIFASTYRNRRVTSNNNYTVTDIRSGIYPYDFIKARKTVEI